ncbi:MAG: class B sortase [Clostridia bacterium]|nr:class B sortase [Clostridia bacterium]
MLNKHEKSLIEDFSDFARSFLPDRKEGITKAIGKLLYLTVAVCFIILSILLWCYFGSAKHQRAIIDSVRERRDNSPSVYTLFKDLKEENSDFTAWLKIQGTNIDNPVYISNKTDYYKKRNMLKKHSRYGALYIPKENSKPYSQNTVIYGNNISDGSMFGTLKYYRNLKFYKQNPTVFLTANGKTETYVIYAVNVVSEKEKKNFTKSEFQGKTSFSLWINKQKKNSIIDTGISVKYGEKILTLITDAKDFDGAKLVVSARKLRTKERYNLDVSKAKVNWYSRHK